jgi:outer membrane protein OmpA-like peptidoglycan-associated protein
MNRTNLTTRMALPLAALALAAPAVVTAQQAAYDPTITVTGEAIPALDTLPAGPELKGVLTARSGDQIKVTAADGSNTVVFVTPATTVKSTGGLFGSSKKKLTTAELLNGLPITVKTAQWSGGLVANQVTFKGSDLKVASMIRNGTAQQFGEQTAATEALRGRMGDIDKYNVKATTNVYFDTGKANLSEQAKAELCNAAATANSTENALLLVVGYTDSTGDEDYNQTLSEKRAAKVINYLQQVCHWQPYRMLTPTGMAEADPVASNDTIDGKAQNRRVAVNVLVSKAVDMQ